MRVSTFSPRLTPRQNFDTIQPTFQPRRRLAYHGNRPVVVAVVTVRVMQMAVDEIVDVVAVWDRFVAAVGAVNMVGVVTGAIVCGCACVRIRVGHLEHVLFDLTVFTNVMQMPVVQVIDMVAVLDAGVFAVRTVLVIVMGVQVRHRVFSFSRISGHSIPSRA